jgi:hypothetical protein
LHPVTSRTMFVDEIDRSGIETMLERLKTSTAMMRAMQMRTLTGAMARVPKEATAFSQQFDVLERAALERRPGIQAPPTGSATARADCLSMTTTRQRRTG